MQQPSRVRELGIIPGTLPTGPLNAITDVPGIRVGQTTIDEGVDLHTGVTAIVPDAPDAGGPLSCRRPLLLATGTASWSAPRRSTSWA